MSSLSGISEIEARLPSSQLMALCRNEAVLKWMSTCDHLMYQALVEILIPDVLRPIPSKQEPFGLILRGEGGGLDPAQNCRLWF